MRSHKIVEETKLGQSDIQSRTTHDFPLVELLFERAEETLDTSVLPWTTRITALLADTCQQQHGAKQSAGEARFIIRSDRAGLTVIFR